MGSPLATHYLRNTGISHSLQPSHPWYYASQQSASLFESVVQNKCAQLPLRPQTLNVSRRFGVDYGTALSMTHAPYQLRDLQGIEPPEILAAEFEFWKCTHHLYPLLDDFLGKHVWESPTSIQTMANADRRFRPAPVTSNRFPTSEGQRHPPSLPPAPKPAHATLPVSLTAVAGSSAHHPIAIDSPVEETEGTALRDSDGVVSGPSADASIYPAPVTRDVGDAATLTDAATSKAANAVANDISTVSTSNKQNTITKRTHSASNQTCGDEEPARKKRRTNGPAIMPGFPTSFAAPPRPLRNQSELIQREVLGKRKYVWMESSNAHVSWDPSSSRPRARASPKRRSAPRQTKGKAPSPTPQQIPKGASSSEPIPAPITKGRVVASQPTPRSLAQTGSGVSCQEKSTARPSVDAILSKPQTIRCNGLTLPCLAGMQGLSQPKATAEASERIVVPTTDDRAHGGEVAGKATCSGPEGGESDDADTESLFGENHIDDDADDSSLFGKDDADGSTQPGEGEDSLDLEAMLLAELNRPE